MGDVGAHLREFSQTHEAFAWVAMEGCHVYGECVTSTESMSRLRRVCHVYGECVTSTESVSRLRRVCPTKPVLCPSRLAMEGCAMCTEGLLNAKPRVPTEYGFVRDRGVPKSFSLTVCMLKLRIHRAKDVCKALN